MWLAQKALIWKTPNTCYSLWSENLTRLVRAPWTQAAADAPGARTGLFGCLLTGLGQEVLISQRNLAEIQESPELTHTFCWVSCHQFKLKSSQSPEHFNWLCFCAAEAGRARAACSLRYWADKKCPRDLWGMGVSAGKERQSCAQTYSVVPQGWLEAPPGQCTAVRVLNDLPLPFSGRITYQSRYIRNPSAFGRIFYGSQRFPAPVILFLSLSGFEYCKSLQWTEDDITPKAQLLIYFSSSF